MTQTPEGEIARLVGARLTGLGRAASLQHFTFRTPSGPEMYLHLEAPWRLTNSDGLVTGRADYWRGATVDTPEEALDVGEIGATLRDVRNERLRERIAIESATVVRTGADRFGGIILEFSNGWRLEVFPDASRASHDKWEFWRLFERGNSHYVVGSDGAELHD